MTISGGSPGDPPPSILQDPEDRIDPGAGCPGPAGLALDWSLRLRRRLRPRGSRSPGDPASEGPGMSLGDLPGPPSCDAATLPGGLLAKIPGLARHPLGACRGPRDPPGGPPGPPGGSRAPARSQGGGWPNPGFWPKVPLGASQGGGPGPPGPGPPARRSWDALGGFPGPPPKVLGPWGPGPPSLRRRGPELAIIGSFWGPQGPKSEQLWTIPGPEEAFWGLQAPEPLAILCPQRPREADRAEKRVRKGPE